MTEPSPSAPSIPPASGASPRLVVTETPIPPPGTAVRVTVEGRLVAIFNVGGSLYGLDSECGHHKAPLEEGTVANGVVTCRKHGAQFRLDSGQVAGGNFLIRRAAHPVRAYRVQAQDGKIAVELR